MALKYFQIIFNPTSAAELAGMPKDLQLQILGEFRGLPEEVRANGFYGRLEHGVKSLHRYRVGNYRVYFECHEFGVVVHRIFSRNTLKDFFFRNVNMTQDEDADGFQTFSFGEWQDFSASASREEA